MNNQQMLLRLGVVDEQGVTARPHLRHCRACGLLVWAAWLNQREDTIAVDPIALTPLGELQALTGALGPRRRTVLHWIDGLDLRRPEWIRRIPASKTNIVRPEHLCDRPAFQHYVESHHHVEHEEPPF